MFRKIQQQGERAGGVGGVGGAVVCKECRAVVSQLQKQKRGTIDIKRNQLQLSVFVAVQYQKCFTPLEVYVYEPLLVFLSQKRSIFGILYIVIAHVARVS